MDILCNSVTQNRLSRTSYFLESYIKFLYSEKATKFCEIFTLLLTLCTVVKSKVKITQNFLAFSDYMNFNCNPPDHICMKALFITKYLVHEGQISGLFVCSTCIEWPIFEKAAWPTFETFFVVWQYVFLLSKYFPFILANTSIGLFLRFLLFYRLFKLSCFDVWQSEFKHPVHMQRIKNQFNKCCHVICNFLGF